MNLPPVTTLVQRILCPVDFSEQSRAVFDYAARMAHFLRAELVVLHVFEPPAVINLSGEDPPEDPELRKQLDALQPPLNVPHVTRVLHTGPAGEAICWLAEQRGCDLSIMGTHGRSGLLHLFLGSVAEHVMRHARCPVLTLRQRPAQEAPLEEPVLAPLPPPRFM